MLGSPLAVAALLSAGGAIGREFHDLLLSLGPVAAWPLDEETGTTASDATGNGHDGTYAGLYTLHQPSIMPSHEGRSAYFNGTLATSVQVPDAASLQLGADGSLVAWASCSDEHFNSLVVKDSLLAGYGLDMRDGQHSSIWTRGLAGTSVLEGDFVRAARLLVGRWSGGNASVWANGAKIAEQLGGWKTAAANVSPVEIALDTPFSADTVGKLQYCAIFDRALTDAEIARLWAASQ
jgi:hypothetical protein